jgi:hypothetical protein
MRGDFLRLAPSRFTELRDYCPSTEMGMRQMIRNLIALCSSFGRRAPALAFGGRNHDWLPPVLGPTDWSSAAMAGMADSSARWYFERADRPDR